MASLDLDLLEALCTPDPRPQHFRESDHLDTSLQKARWEAVCKLVTQPAWDKAADQWMERAERALAAWRDVERAWPHAWFRRKVAPRATRLARALHLGGQSAASHSAIFAQLATLDADTMPPITELRLAYGRYNLKKQPSDMMDAAQAALLLERLALNPLTTLYISGGDSPALWEALADAPALASLRRFGCSLYKNPHIPRAVYDAGFEALLASPHLRALERFDVYSYEYPRQARQPPRAVELLITHHAERITSLIWPLCRGAELEAMCDARWPALRTLHLREPMTLEQLARRIDHAPALDELTLWGALSGASMIAGQPSALRKVDLMHCGLDATQAASLLQDPRLANVEQLAMRQMPLDARAIPALVSMPLRTLYLELTTPDALWPALAGQRMEHLTQLTIEARSIHDVLSLDLPALRALTLKAPALTMQELDALEAAPWYGQLRELVLPYESRPDPLNQRTLGMMRAINLPGG